MRVEYFFDALNMFFDLSPVGMCCNVVMFSVLLHSTIKDCGDSQELWSFLLFFATSFSWIQQS